MDRNGYRRLSRGLWSVAGLFGFLWLGYEDRGLWAVSILAWLLGMAALATWRARRGPGGGDLRWWIPAGAALGAAVSALAVLLILVKLGLHAHPIPDFTASDVRSVLGRAPLWGIAGASLGAGSALLERSRSGSR